MFIHRLMIAFIIPIKCEVFFYSVVMQEGSRMTGKPYLSGKHLHKH